MIFGEPPAFSEIIETIAALEKRINEQAAKPMRLGQE
jgi:hypothetical protein